MSTLKVQIGANISQLEKALSTAQGRLKSFGSSMSSLGRTLSTRVTAPLVALGGLSLKTAADFETLQQSMNVLNGSVEEGARNFQRLKEFSAGTPFQLKDLAQAQNMLQGFGLAADDAFNSLSMIGDIAAITGGDIQGIGIAFGQAAAEGKLFTRDIRQLINQGVPAIQLLANTMGVAQSEILEMASEGKISFDILQQAFRDATSEGGMFANGMEHQANTLNGIWSTLKDNVSIALAELGQSIADTFNIREHAKELIANIQSVVKWFQSLSDEGRATMLKIVAAIALVPPALVGLGAAFATVGVIIAGLTSPIFLVTAAISSMVLAFEYVRRNIDAFVDHFMFGFTNLKNDVLQNIADMQEAIAKWAIFLPGITEAAILQARASILSLKDPVPEIESEFQSLGEFFKDLGGDIVGIFEQITGLDFSTMFEMSGGGGGAVEKVEEWANSINASTRSVADTNEQTASRLASSMADMVGTVQAGSQRIPEHLQFMVEQSQRLGDALQSTITEAAVSFADSFGQMIASGVSAGHFFDNLITMLADFASQFGKILIGIGTAALALRPESLFSNPFAAIAAGVALVALGGAIKSLVRKGPGGHGGAGGDSVDQFQRSARNVQSQQGGQVEFRIQGNDLVGVLQNASVSQRRTGRTTPLNR